MKSLLPLILIIFFGYSHSYTQTIDWVAETGLPLGSTLANGQVIPNFAGTGISVTINVNTVGGFPSIDPVDNTKLVMTNADGASFTLTTSGGGELDIVLNNAQNLLSGEVITLSNPDGQNITIEETASGGGPRMMVDGVAMSGGLPSIIVEDNTAVINEQDDAAGTEWNASMDAISSFTWLYNTSAGTSSNEGFILTIIDSRLSATVPTLNQWGLIILSLLLLNLSILFLYKRKRRFALG